MTAPQRAEDALRRAVENQRAQREAASEVSREIKAAKEEGVETPERDNES